MIFGTFFTITGSSTAEVIGYAHDIITDITPLLLIIVGVAVGLFIFWGIISAIKH